MLMQSADKAHFPAPMYFVKRLMRSAATVFLKIISLFLSFVAFASAVGSFGRRNDDSPLLRTQSSKAFPSKPRMLRLPLGFLPF